MYINISTVNGNDITINATNKDEFVIKGSKLINTLQEVGSPVPAFAKTPEMIRETLNKIWDGVEASIR